MAFSKRLASSFIALADGERDSEPVFVAGASQQAAASVPVTVAPLFTVLVASVEQSTSPVAPVLPVHLPVTVQPAYGVSTLVQASIVTML